MVSAAEDKQMIFIVHVYFNPERYSGLVLPLVAKNTFNKEIDIPHLYVFANVTLSHLQFCNTFEKVWRETQRLESATQIGL